MESCIGCGGLFDPQCGPTHAYMKSSPACWAAFGRILGAEYSDPRLLPSHRLSVDTFAVQHPGGSSRRAIQSVGLHLARLYLQIEKEVSPADANAFMLRFSRRKSELPRLQPPASFRITTGDVHLSAGTDEHIPVVRAWAESAWDDWSMAHGFIRNWASESLC